ncbi:JNK-interacting protein 1 [Aphelenchoides besseyi]|nr:JNK-interacting protein 1 [Aphelenchoides besseyi]
MVSDDSTAETEDDDDAELEQLVEKSVRRFIGIGSSRSAHANLSQLASNQWTPTTSVELKSQVERNESVEDDSDEEFYSLHPSLLPFRKSKSTAFELKPLSSEVSMTEIDQQARGYRRTPIGRVNASSAFVDDSTGVGILSPRTTNGISMVWPEPDDCRARRKPPTHPTVNLDRGDVLTVRTQIPEDDFPVCGAETSVSCWSAPSQYDESESVTSDLKIKRRCSRLSSTSSSICERFGIGKMSANVESDESGDEDELLTDEGTIGEHIPRSWSAPPRVLQFGGAESLLAEDDAMVMANDYATDDDALVIRPLRSNQRGMVRSFSSDDAFMKRRRRQHHLLWSSSCYALSVADENEENEYVSSEYDGVEDQEKPSGDEKRFEENEDGKSKAVNRTHSCLGELNSNAASDDAMSIDADEELRTRSVSPIEEAEFSDYENDSEQEDEEEDDEFMESLDPSMKEFTVRRQSQFFIRGSARRSMAQSKSDGQLVSAPTNLNAFPTSLRPRTPLFGTSRNQRHVVNQTSESSISPTSEIVEDDFEFAQLPPILLRHSATYHGHSNGCAMACGMSRLPRSRLSFIDGLKLKQRLRDEAESLKRETERAAQNPVVNVESELPDDLVESFAIENETITTESDRKMDGLDDTKGLNDEETIPKDAEEEANEISELENQRSLLLLLGSPDRAESLPGNWQPEIRNDQLYEENKDVEMSPTDSTRRPMEMKACLRDLEQITNDDDEVMSARSYAYAGSIGDDLEVPMMDDENIPPPAIPSNIAAPRALRRRSPPIASEDELSDSEISELERQLAHRQLTRTDSDNKNGMPSQACQSPEVDIHYCRQPRDFYHFLPGSSSMPSFALRADLKSSFGSQLHEHERQRLEETANWLRKSKTQNFNDENLENTEVTVEQRTQLSGSRRRILPIRPDEPMRAYHPPQAIVQPSQVQDLLHPVSRRLPNLPSCQLIQAVVQPYAYQQNGSMGTNVVASANSTPKSMIQPTANVTPLRPNENVVHPLLRHTKPPPPNSLPPRGAIASQLGHEHDYQLSYGIEQSLVRSTTNYGLEDSYYEDGLNGNSTHFDRKNSSGISSFASSDPSNLGPTHRAQFTFVPRHDDEVLLEIGDALKVEREYEDHWCFGTNLRTGQQGLFPAAHVCEIDLVDEITSSVLPVNIKPQKAERDTFYLTLLASIEVAHHKGNDVLVQAINKVCEMYQSKEEILVPQTVLMEINFRGVHVIDKRKKDVSYDPQNRLISSFRSSDVQLSITSIHFKTFHFVVHIRNSYVILASLPNTRFCHDLHVTFSYRMNQHNRSSSPLDVHSNVLTMNTWPSHIRPKTFTLSNGLKFDCYAWCFSIIPKPS